MKTITINTFKSELESYLNSVSQFSEVIGVSVNDSKDEKVIIMSMKEYRSFKETKYILSSKANRKRLDETIEQYNNGQLSGY